MSASTDITPTLGSIFAVERSKEPHAPSAGLFKDRFRHAKAALPELGEGLPGIERWGKEMGARPAMQRALKF